MANHKHDYATMFRFDLKKMLENVICLNIAPSHPGIAYFTRQNTEGNVAFIMFGS